MSDDPKWTLVRGPTGWAAEWLRDTDNFAWFRPDQFGRVRSFVSLGSAPRISFSKLNECAAEILKRDPRRRWGRGTGEDRAQLCGMYAALLNGETLP